MDFSIQNFLTNLLLIKEYLLTHHTFNDLINYFFIFFLGSVFGSFITMLIYRLFKLEIALYENKKEEAKDIFKSMLVGRSYCPVCKNKLEPKHLVPLFSYIFLRGKCGFCGTKIPISYFLIELFLGLLFLFFYIYIHVIGLNVPFYIEGLLFALLLILYVLLIYDIKYLYLTETINFFGYLLSLFGIFYLFLLNKFLGIFAVSFIVINYLFFLLINVFGKLYFGLKKGFKNIKGLEIIGTGDFFALFNILSFGIIIITLRFKEFILKEFLFDQIIGFSFNFFYFYITIASIISIMYYIITIFIEYKNETQEETEKEFKENNINSPVIPFLPGLIISIFITLLFI